MRVADSDDVDRWFIDRPDVPPTPSGVVARVISRLLRHLDTGVARSANVLLSIAFTDRQVPKESRQLTMQLMLVIWVACAFLIGLLAVVATAWAGPGGNALSVGLRLLTGLVWAESLLWLVRRARLEWVGRGRAPGDDVRVGTSATVENMACLAGVAIALFSRL